MSDGASIALPLVLIPVERNRPTLRQFVLVVNTLGVLVVVQALYALAYAPMPLGWALAGGLAIFAGSFALKVPGVPVYLSISDTFFITSALLFGPAPATITIAVDSAIMSWRRGHKAHQAFFNAMSSAISLGAAGFTFFWLSNTGPLITEPTAPGALRMLQIVGLATVYFVLNSGLIATAVALQKREPIFALWKLHFAIVGLSHLAAASASFVLLVLLHSVNPIAVAAVLPLLLIFQLAMRSWVGRLDDAKQHVDKVTRLYLSTVSALSTAIEAKDGVTSEHIHRVQAYAMGLAKALSVTDPLTLQAIEAAALLHDTGKLAIPEHILNKPGKLTPAEFETMKSHVDVGADILSSIDFPYPVIPIVRAHHESWDGSGYPAGLRGEEIPIGARILSVVDCFDALTSDRPYRLAMTAEAAEAIILERRGIMYDPIVVDTFLRVRAQIVVNPPMPQLQHALTRIKHSRDAADPIVAAGPAAAIAPPDASEQMLALVSLARVASQKPTVADVGTLAWSHIRQMAPGASFALFVVEPGRTQIQLHYASGGALQPLVGKVIGFGECLSGWVAANKRVMLNSDARLDLASLSDHPLRYGLALPLINEGEIAGVMTLYSAEPFNEDQSRMMEMIAPHLAVSIAVALVSGRETLSHSTAEPLRVKRSELRVVARR